MQKSDIPVPISPTVRPRRPADRGLTGEEPRPQRHRRGAGLRRRPSPGIPGRATTYGGTHHAIKNIDGAAGLNIHATTAHGDITARDLLKEHLS
jgi:hypothetical protein